MTHAAAPEEGSDLVVTDNAAAQHGRAGRLLDEIGELDLRVEEALDLGADQIIARACTGRKSAPFAGSSSRAALNTSLTRAHCSGVMACPRIRRTRARCSEWIAVCPNKYRARCVRGERNGSNCAP